MKTLILYLLACLAANAQIPYTITRAGTNLSITWHTNVYAATLEITRSMAHWNEIAKQSDDCASEKTWVIPADKDIRFYRLKLLDNGIVPTPPGPKGFVMGTNLALSCGRLFNCHDDPMSYYRWFTNGVAFTNGGSSIVVPISSGLRRYSVVAFDGTNSSWMSPELEVEF